MVLAQARVMRTADDADVGVSDAINRVPTGVGVEAEVDCVFSAKALTSSRETRPFALEGVTCSRSMPSSKASLRTAGAASTRIFGAAVCVVEAGDVGAAAWVAMAVGVALLVGAVKSPLDDAEGASKTTSTSPTLAVWPLGTRISETRPATGAGISTMALSVSTLTTV